MDFHYEPNPHLRLGKNRLRHRNHSFPYSLYSVHTISKRNLRRSDEAFTLRELAGLSLEFIQQAGRTALAPLHYTRKLQRFIRSPRRAILRWWADRCETHYLICAEVEKQRERQARQDAQYYEMKAALARADKFLL